MKKYHEWEQKEEQQSKTTPVQSPAVGYMHYYKLFHIQLTATDLDLRTLLFQEHKAIRSKIEYLNIALKKGNKKPLFWES